MMRPVSLTVAVTLLVATSAAAQDRLFVDAYGVAAAEVGAIGRFGRRLGAPPPDAFTAMPPLAVRFTATMTTVVSVDTGTVVWNAPAGTIVVEPLVATSDGTRVFVTTFEGSGFNARWWLNAVDVASGNTVAQLGGGLAYTQWDPVGRRLIGVTFDGGPAFAIFDENLNSLGTFRPWPGSHCAPSLYISAHTARAYIAYVAEGSAGSYGPSDTRLMAVDLRRNVVVDDVSLVASLGISNRATCPPRVALWTAPPAPMGLATRISGRDVTLSWLATDLAEAYVVDAGVGPGRTDVSFFVGGTRQVIFANVPPGTYYVRIRASNRMGGGRPSNEVTVVVP